MTKGLTMRLIPALMMMGFAGVAGAAGFALQNQTGSGNGNAFAGAAAAAEDAGTVYFNPAGMTNLPQGHNIALGGTLLRRTIDFDDTGTVSNSGLAPLHANRDDGGNAGGLGVIPFGYWAYSVSPSLWVGLGISPTFGNKTDYDFSFTGRNAGYFADLKQININPSIAYKVNEKLSLGGGLNFAHNSTHFKQGVPLAAGPFPANNWIDIEGDDWGYGYNLGLTFQPSPSTRIGLTYRSEIKFNLKGDYDIATAVLAGGNATIDHKIKGRLETPASASLAVMQKLSDKWEMLGDFTWTDWSTIDDVIIKDRTTGASIAKLSYNFKDGWRVGLGANYQYNDDWKIRFGIAYDKTPVKSAQDRTMTLPDSDRFWLSFGAKYQLSKVNSVDFSYSHIFFKDARTNRAVTTGFPGAETLRQTVNGKWDNNSADLLSVQYNHTF